MKLLEKVGSVMKSTTGRTGLVLKKYSPEITLTLGIVSFVATVVTASRASMKLYDVLEEDRRELINIDAYVEVNPDSEYVQNEDHKRDKLIVYSRLTVKTLKLYAPSIALGTVSIALILTSRNIMHKRYLAAVCAYNSVTEAFEAYRRRVVDEYGENLDKHFRYGTVYDEVSETVTDENGKKHKEKSIVESVDTSNVEGLTGAVIFDETNPNWDSNNGFNRSFLFAQQEHFTNILNSRGHIFLNEVYRGLGFPHTAEGALLGWIKPEDGREGFVDFGLYNATEGSKSFIDGRDNVVLLDFNVDGVIFDKI